ncbi:MAG: PAS domain-containing protein [Pararhodobacter sp.]
MTTRIPDALLSFLQRSGVPLTLADAGVEDMPLISANAAFTSLTGYATDEVIGRNCRFLQPADGAGPVRTRIREFLAADPENTERFLVPNQRKDGSGFVNVLYLTKIYQDGHCAFVLGSQFDASRIDGRSDSLYDAALATDVRQISVLMGESGYLMFGSVEALATSAAMIARNKGRQP